MKAYGPGLVCPACGGKTAVTDSRGGDTFIRRRRKCMSCGVRCTTVEAAFPSYQRGTTFPSDVTQAMTLGAAINRMSFAHRDIVMKLIAAFGEEKDTA